MTEKNTKITSPIQWVGGKSQLLPTLHKHFPQGLETGEITTYVEPFFGGGAVFFDIANRYSETLEQLIVNDINPNLVNLYRVIQQSPDALIERLTNLREQYLALDFDGKSAMYYNMREQFNTVITSPLTNDASSEAAVSRAAMLVFINKTCFNALYRVNRRGLLNSPFGKQEKPSFFNEENLRNVHELFKKTTILWGDYSQTFEYAGENTFVYLDPPYRPLTQTASFNAYDSSVFSDNEQVALGGFIHKLDEKGAKIMLSNSDPKNNDENDAFFDNLYETMRIERVSALRRVSSKASTRGAISEILVMNYENESDDVREQ